MPGFFISKPFTEYTVGELQVVTETNLSGFFHISQLAVEQMRRQQSGHVVNINASQQASLWQASRQVLQS